MPYHPVLSIRAVWRLAAGWAPFVLLVDTGRLALAGSVTAWDVALVAACFVAICAAARKATNAPTRPAAVGWAFVSWALAGATLASQLPFAASALLLLMIPLSTIAGAWHVGLAARLYPALREGTHETVDRATATAAAWVALPFLLFGLAQISFGGPEGLSLFLRSAGALVALPPLAVVLLARLRISDRRRWLRLVREGLIADWRIVDAQPHGAPRGLPVLVGEARGALAAGGGGAAGESAGQGVRVLERTRIAEDPFRATDAEPFALVGEIPGLSAPPRERPPTG